MKIAHLFLITALVGVLAVIGCDSSTSGEAGSGGNGGTAGSAGDGGTGGGGTSCGTEPAQEICCFGRCLGDDMASQVLFDECVDAVNLCLDTGGTDAECKLVADQKCVGG